MISAFKFLSAVLADLLALSSNSPLRMYSTSHYYLSVPYLSLPFLFRLISVGLVGSVLLARASRLTPQARMHFAHLRDCQCVERYKIRLLLVCS